ncbi:hypothetical protein NONI108955_37385 [Nocardia ninae]|uniref:Uncharacterized protein n=1 Tax=Nocardia ninae NBRC 108245 TaxID=1210091 RepID=A0A511M8K6_9NOCA|nr:MULTISPECIES: hypothetical protein [Nocardia]GEM36448.1 hypothetical protein NN4_09670 [Nocardia ninae NBRC 108245]
MRSVGFEWPDWALDMLIGISPNEVMQVLTKQRRWPRRGRGSTGIEMLTIWGRTAAGRPLIVGLRQAEPWQWQIVAARPMSPEQVAEFEKWEQENQ